MHENHASIVALHRLKPFFKKSAETFASTQYNRFRNSFCTHTLASAVVSRIHSCCFCSVDTRDVYGGRFFQKSISARWHFLSTMAAVAISFFYCRGAARQRLNFWKNFSFFPKKSMLEIIILLCL